MVAGLADAGTSMPDEELRERSYMVCGCDLFNGFIQVHRCIAEPAGMRCCSGCCSAQGVALGRMRCSGIRRVADCIPIVRYWVASGSLETVIQSALFGGVQPDLGVGCT